MAVKPELSLETITPTIAREMLKLNVKNRRVVGEEVDYLAGAMSRGEWVLNGETISFADDETLLDGQHRLHAVIASGVSIETLVMRDVPASARDVIGTGRKRQLSEQLAIEGFKRSCYLAGAVNSLHRFTGEEIQQGRANRPTTTQALQRLQECPTLEQSVAVVSVIPRNLGFGPVGVLATMHFLFSEVDPDPAEEFFARLIDGVELSRGDPVLLLRNRLMSESFQPQRDRKLKPHNVAHLTIVAFNHRRAGNRLEKLRARWNDPFPEILPPAVIERRREEDHFRHHHRENAEEKETIGERVRAVVQASTAPVSPKEVSARLDPPAPTSTVNACLWRDAEDGRIRRLGRGLYASLEAGSPPSNGASTRERRPAFVQKLNS